MDTRPIATPFGRRSVTLGHLASQAACEARPLDRAVHKWNLFRSICTARVRIGVSERALAVLDALLSFHPETALIGADLVVFPSNQQLSLRAHGMAPATLRRHLAVLVDAGLIVRRDSPNGKRYARKDKAGELERAFGFDLGPLVARADELEMWAEEVRAEERALKLLREQITLCRRDIAKMIATGMEEGVAVRRGGQGAGDWIELHALYRAIVERIPRNATRRVLEPIAQDLALLAEEIHSALEMHIKTTKPSANESQTERHKQSSNTNNLVDLEPRFQKSEGARPEPQAAAVKPSEATYPLGMVLDACPDLIDYARGGISNWRDFLATISVVRPMLGISPSAWEEAQIAMGERQAAIVVAALLQRGTAISSAGGYIRDLTRKAEAGSFVVGPMLMALIGKRRGEKKRA